MGDKDKLDTTAKGVSGKTEKLKQPAQRNLSDSDKAAKAQAYVNAVKSEQETAAPADEDGATVTKQKKSGTGLLWFFLLCTLLLSAAAGYGVYYLWQQQQLRYEQQQTSAKSSETELQQARTAIVDVRDDFKNLRSDVGEQASSYRDELAATQDGIALLEKTLAKQRRQMQSLTQTNREEWLLAETEYLLRLANQRVLMMKESSGAMAMLQSADRILHDIDDTSLRTVRSAIAEDLAALRAAEPVDVDGEYLKLAALTERLDDLALHETPEFETDTSEEDVEASMPEEQSWTDTLAQAAGSITATLGKAFVVRHHDKPIEAMLPPQQELYLRQNLRLMLEQAQLALLARKPEIYQQGLDKAQQWIARYFISDDAATQAALETLAEARGVDIDPPLPDISGSYHALRKFMESSQADRLMGKQNNLEKPTLSEDDAETATPPQDNVSEEDDSDALQENAPVDEKNDGEDTVEEEKSSVESGKDAAEDETQLTQPEGKTEEPAADTEPTPSADSGA